MNKHKVKHHRNSDTKTANRDHIGKTEQRKSDHFRQLWNNELNNSSKAVFYRSISQFRFQDYLEIVTVNKFRTALAKLRLSPHRLEVETG